MCRVPLLQCRLKGLRTVCVYGGGDSLVVVPTMVILLTIAQCCVHRLDGVVSQCPRI